jgi:hypothetical protein
MQTVPSLAPIEIECTALNSGVQVQYSDLSEVRSTLYDLGPNLSGAVTTEDSVLLGFGLEQVESVDERAAIVKTAMQHLFGVASPARVARR